MSVSPCCAVLELCESSVSEQKRSAEKIEGGQLASFWRAKIHQMFKKIPVKLSIRYSPIYQQIRSRLNVSAHVFFLHVAFCLLFLVLKCTKVAKTRWKWKSRRRNIHLRHLLLRTTTTSSTSLFVCWLVPSSFDVVVKRKYISVLISLMH